MLKRIAFAPTVFLLAGCSVTANIKDAWIISSPNGNSSVHVKVSAKDAEFIKRNQIYFSIILQECSGDSKRYPMESTVSGKRASDFEFKTSNTEVVDFVAVGPTWAIRAYRDPCVMLEGGAYTGAQLQSNRVPLRTR